MSDDATVQFYPSKPRLVHMALNIALAPVLLYLIGFWPWPPTLPHYMTFAITGLIGMRYFRQRWNQPRLIVDDKGLHAGEFYPWESIRQMETVMRALRLTLMQENGEVKQKLVNLGWASNADFKHILQVVDQRYQQYTRR